MSHFTHALVMALAIATLGEVVRAQGQNENLLTYGIECARQIATVPEFDCRTGVVAAITVNNTVPVSYKPMMECDRPSLLPNGDDVAGQCVPYSRALVLVDDGRVQISAFCREKQIRPSNTHLYDEIDVIEHSVATGKTCWFQATGSSPEHPIEGNHVPSPSTLAGGTFWNTPAMTAAELCVSCHDSGPFVYSPFIAQTGQVPSDPLGKYSNEVGIDFKKWPKPLAISTAGNTCTTCHRIGSMNTCRSMIYKSTGGSVNGADTFARGYPNSHWMPPGNWLSKEGWKLVYKRSVDRLATCCNSPSSLDCVFTPIPGE